MARMDFFRKGGMKWIIIIAIIIVLEPIGVFGEEWSSLPQEDVLNDYSHNRDLPYKKRSPASFQYCVDANGITYEMADPNYDTCLLERVYERDTMVIRNFEYDF